MLVGLAVTMLPSVANSGPTTTAAVNTVKAKSLRLGLGLGYEPMIYGKPIGRVRKSNLKVSTNNNVMLTRF